MLASCFSIASCFLLPIQLPSTSHHAGTLQSLRSASSAPQANDWSALSSRFGVV